MQRDRNACQRQITSVRDLRSTFWEQHPGLSRQRYRNGDYPADTRMAFVDYVDHCARDGLISERLAQRATLER